MSLEFKSKLMNMKKVELIDLAQKFNLHYKIHNIQKLKKQQLIVELLVFEKEVQKIYNEDKSKPEIRKEKGLPEPKPRKARDQEKLKKDIKDLENLTNPLLEELYKPENFEKPIVRKSILGQITKIQEKIISLDKLRI